MANLPIRQMAYFVPDIAAAAAAHSAIFGSGPFFAFSHVELASSLHRGQPHLWDHSSLYGQWGDVMIEFLTQHSDEPSAVRDLYPAHAGQFGFHHTAVFVDDLNAAIADFEASGMPLAQLSETVTGTRFAFVDASESLGHMIELYEPSQTLIGFYAMVRDASKGWDGGDLIRPLN